MDWQEIYKSRLCTADKAVKVIKSRDFLVVQDSANTPSLLLEAMLKRDDLHDVELMHMGIIMPAVHCRPEYKDKVRINTPFTAMDPEIARAVNEGRGDFTPVYYGELPKMLREYKRPDGVMIMVTPPDEKGYCNLGLTVNYITDAVKLVNGYIIAQVNNKMPRVIGDSDIHVSQIDCFVEHDSKLPYYPVPPLNDVSNEIGKNCATLVEDRACIQLGVGPIPDALVKFLEDKNDLGIHTELMMTGVVNLMKKGVVTGKYKNIDKELAVVNFCMGTTDETYEFVHENPKVVFRSVEYLLDPYVISQNDNVVSIQSCLQVDILGQVCSATIGYKQYAGVGGQVDFVRGCARSKNGKSIMAITSTTAKDTISRIVPTLDEGAAVTTSRYDVHYIVTEYGIANLKYRTNKERAKALISIAHPKFREELEHAARKRNIL